MDQANDFQGAVSLSNSGSNDVTIDDANDLVLGTVSIAAGNLNVDNAGTITQTGVVSVGGNTVLDNSDGDNADITLTNASNAFTGTVTFTTDSGSDISITDTTAFDLVALTANTLTVNAGGAVTDSGTLAIPGATTISASGQDITLDEAASTFGTLALTGANVAVTEAGATDLGASTVSGTLGITSGGAVTDSGTLAITGADDDQCSGQDHYFG